MSKGPVKLFDEADNAADDSLDLSSFKPRKRTSPSGAMETFRRLAEEPHPGPGKVDGRKLRATGRTQQLNIRVTADTRERYFAIAQAANLSVAELLEALLDNWETREK